MKISTRNRLLGLAGVAALSLAAAWPAGAVPPIPGGSEPSLVWAVPPPTQTVFVSGVEQTISFQSTVTTGG